MLLIHLLIRPACTLLQDAESFHDLLRFPEWLSLIFEPGVRTELVITFMDADFKIGGDPPARQ